MPDELSLSPLKILLAEDGKSNQVMAVSLLSKWGHEVTVAENGERAVSLYQTGTFDLILMDVQMPVLDGLAATERIRDLEIGTGQRIPVIAMTARAMKGDREICLAAGMDEYLAKPVRAAELAAALHKFATCPNDTAFEDDEGDAKTPRSESCSLVNWDAALDAMNGDANIMRKVVDAVLEEAPELLLKLQHAVDADDHEQVRMAAHTIKGTMRTFHVPSVTDIAFALEEDGRTRDLENAPQKIVELETQLEHVLRELRSYCGRETTGNQ